MKTDPKKPYSLLRLVAIVFFLAMAVYFGNDVWNYYQERWAARRNQESLEELYQQGDTAVPGQSQETVPGDSQGQPSMLPRYSQLVEINPDLVGWINLAQGGLSTAVVQRDNEYYLDHDFYQKQNRHGQIFLDERNDPNLGDDVSVLYGHNLPSDKAMFNILENYRKADYLAQYPTFRYDTLYEEGEYAIFAVFLASTRPEHGAVFDYINHLNFSTPQEKEAFFQEILDRSLLDTGVEVDANDSVMLLSTCAYEFSDARLVVAGRRLRPGETAEDFGKDVQKAEDPLMPEIWESMYGSGE